MDKMDKIWTGVDPRKENLGSLSIQESKLQTKLAGQSYTYILLDVLLCSIAEYFYELCRILASP